MFKMIYTIYANVVAEQTIISIMQNRTRKLFFDFANLGKMIDLIAIMIDT